MLNLLRGQASGSVLVRLMISDPALRSVPWEAMKGPGDADAALACNTKVRLVRGVYSDTPSVPREVRGAVRILAVAPEEMAYAVHGLEAELAPQIEAGLVEWLEPAKGEGARWPNLVQRLQRSPWPHVIHVVAHGRVEAGQSQLLLEPQGGRWTPTETLASALSGRVADELRLVYLESCSGGEAGAQVSTAERLAATGVDAVVAHLWTADAAAARTVALQFYSALTTTAAGDIAASLSQARLAIAGTSNAEFLCPVLYLRGNDPVLFDFKRRKLQSRPARSASGGASGGSLTPRLLELLDDLQEALDDACTVFIGERVGPRDNIWGDEALRSRLLSRLDLEEEGRFEPLAQLLQRYELVTARDDLRDLLQDVLDPLAEEDETSSPLLEGLARAARPGLFVTLLWLPVVEHALARQQPDQDIVVLQPQDPAFERALRVYRRRAGSIRFEVDDDGLEEVDFGRDLVVLRLFGGYLATNARLRGKPVLTDDDRLRNLVEVDNLPRTVLAYVRHHPMVVLGLSPVRWSDRQLLHGLVGDQPLRRGSLAFVAGAARESERAFWTAEGGPAGRSGRVKVHTQTDLAEALAAASPGG